jgi:hypothetical protein
VPSGKKNVRVFENGFEIHNVKMGDPHGKLAKGGKTVKVRWVGTVPLSVVCCQGAGECMLWLQTPWGFLGCQPAALAVPSLHLWPRCATRHPLVNKQRSPPQTGRCRDKWGVWDLPQP